MFSQFGELEGSVTAVYVGSKFYVHQWATTWGYTVQKDTHAQCAWSHLCTNITARDIWAAPSEFGTYRLCEQRRFRRACASAQSRQNLRCSLIQAVSQEEPSDRKPDPWPLWMAGHAQLKFVMTECSKTQIRLAGLICSMFMVHNIGGNKEFYLKSDDEQSKHKIPQGMW